MSVIGTFKHRAEQHGASSSACTWYQKSISVPANWKLNLQLTRMTKAEFVKVVSRKKTATPLQGLGRAAYVFDDGRLVTVWQHGIVVTVVNHTATPLPTAKTVTNIVLGQL